MLVVVRGLAVLTVVGAVPPQVWARAEPGVASGFRSVARGESPARTGRLRSPGASMLPVPPVVSRPFTAHRGAARTRRHRSAQQDYRQWKAHVRLLDPIVQAIWGAAGSSGDVFLKNGTLYNAIGGRRHLALEPDARPSLPDLQDVDVEVVGADRDALISAIKRAAKEHLDVDAIVRPHKHHPATTPGLQPELAPQHIQILLPVRDRSCIQLDICLHSPAVRAVETATPWFTEREPWRLNRKRAFSDQLIDLTRITSVRSAKRLAPGLNAQTVEDALEGVPRLVMAGTPAERKHEPLFLWMYKLTKTTSKHIPEEVALRQLTEAGILGPRLVGELQTFFGTDLPAIDGPDPLSERRINYLLSQFKVNHGTRDMQRVLGFMDHAGIADFFPGLREVFDDPHRRQITLDAVLKAHERASRRWTELARAAECGAPNEADHRDHVFGALFVTMDKAAFEQAIAPLTRGLPVDLAQAQNGYLSSLRGIALGRIAAHARYRAFGLDATEIPQ